MKKVRLNVEVLQNEEGYYFAQIHDVPGVYTWGESFDVIASGIREAVQLHFEGLAEDGALPEKWMGEPEFMFRMPVNAILDLLGLENKNLAKSSGINQTLLSQYRTGIKKAGAKQKHRLNETIQRLAENLKHIEVV